MHTNPSSVDSKITAAIAGDARTQAAWARLLGLTRQATNDRARGRTRWTLADAITVARTLEVSLDSLVGDDDLPLGYAPVEADAEELPAGALELEREHLAPVVTIYAGHERLDPDAAVARADAAELAAERGE